ncbi:hypothetical protein L226DRAFT_539922 [Lentinus tigrinus ALCF2SS1-7]|uniref:uncharacterized protein n=1 Tax=Lentinus tigrinus ALCF2SS1-7 TaxID=1328758 RepID=UPI0011662929|nr:hypothetical protein L226DRAFT_539922 [Lentinus tigrinus ALCF2SS1-7]
MASENGTPMIRSIDTTFGALLISAFIAVVFYGIGVHQFHRYMRLFPTDSLSIRAVAFLTMLFSTFHTIVIIHACYYYLVSNYFKPVVLNEVAWSANMMVVTSAFVSITAQSFFARRVSLIGFKFKVLAAISVVFLGLRLASEILLAIKGFDSNDIRTTFTFTHNQWVLAVNTAAPTMVDLILSGSVFSVLWNSHHATTRGNDSWIDLFVIYGINTGLLILVCDLLSLVLALSRPHDLYWVPATLIATRLTMNTIFCVLNSRKLLVSRGIEIFDTGSPFGTGILARANRLATVERWNVPQDPGELPPAMIDIKVTQEMEGEGGDGNSIEMTSPIRRHDVKNSVVSV